MRNFYKFTFILLFSVCAKAQVPTATILSASAVYCTDAPTFFAAQVDTGGSSTSYTWAIAPAKNSAFVSGFSGTTTVCTFSVPGTYTISLHLANSSGTTTITKLLSVTRSALASFNASLTTAGFPNQLSLTNYSGNSSKAYWLFNDTPAKDSANYVLRDYYGSGNYTVTLVALGRNGCNDTLSYGFRIADSSGVTLPNIFSPNDDGVNDIFRPITRGIVQLSAWVYNRYGAPIITWDKVNGFWDGYTTSGMQCQEGEYFIVIKATGFDGRSYKLKSSITLVR